MIKTAVIGAPGYSGEELVRILAYHPRAQVAYASGREDRTEKIQEIFPYLEGALDIECRAFHPEEAAKAADVIFLCLPHTVSMKYAGFFLERGKKVIDVSSDFRLKNPAEFQKYYGENHTDTANLKKAVYGLTEQNREEIRSATLVANPGCYPTGAALGLLPLIQKGIEWTGKCVIDAKSGATGAGRKAATSLLFSEVNENFKAYKVLNHQHEGEIGQTIRSGKLKNTSFVFVPHLLPIDRGILSTIYIDLADKKIAKLLSSIYSEFYHREPFIHVMSPGRMPEVKNVRGTNQCHIGIAHRDDGTAVILTAIDNLGKGAAGQAVQNMNLMFGLAETEGLLK